MPEIPFAFQWTIPENQLIRLKDSVNELLCTSWVKNIPGFEYGLSVIPNVEEGAVRQQTCICLEIKFGVVKKVEANYTIKIESASFSFAIYHTFETSDSACLLVASTPDFFNPEMEFIVDGKCTIKVEGIFKFGESISAAGKEQKWVGGELGDEFWEDDESKDFVIVVEDKQIKVHKLVLRIRSPVFSAMLGPETKETAESKVEIIDFSFEVVEAAVKMIYNCNCVTTLSLDEMMSLLQFFDKYQIAALKDKIETLLNGRIFCATVCRITNCSILTNSQKLKEKCMEFLMRCFASKTPISDLQSLDKDVAIEILQNHLYHVVSTDG